MNRIKRPALRYHGGKWKLASWIGSHFPVHRTYVEPFAGAASVLLRKPKSHAEVYNDLDEEIVSFFRVMRDTDQAARLIRQLELTPFARQEFEAAYEEASDPVERARRLLIRSFMGFGSDGHNDARQTGFRANSNRRGTTPARDWANLPEAHTRLTARLSGVIIENRDAKACMEQHDSAKTLFYCDPPYVGSTRAPARNSERKNYRHEMSDSDHEDLLRFLRSLEGMVVLSGYRCDLYDDHLQGWTRFDRTAFADGARPRTESLWLNPAADVPDLFTKERA